MSALAAAPSAARTRGIALPAGASMALHVFLAAMVLWYRTPPPKARPPVYAVRLVAAPAAPRAEGVVTSTPAPPPTPVPTHPLTQRPITPREVKPTVQPKGKTVAPPKQVTPSPVRPAPAKAAPKTPAPVAGGGPEGGHGSDVANVDTPGVDFADKPYLDNIVRQLALQFHPPSGAALSAKVQFIIHRDGTVDGTTLTEGSPSFAFNLAARGAVEAAGSVRAFGPLPAGFPNDVLVVVFSFDPSVIR